ncbi:MAG TPA: thioredoxin domain-containing protein [Humibacter sp.]|jgi:protein-disulfide isomerase|nr:thioredoxin domain-containing protein [Humibacter sp.]
MSNGDPAERPNNGERRAAARDKARQLRERHRKQERRRSAVVRTSIIAVVIAAAAVVAVVIVSSIHAPEHGPANMASDGILIGKDMKAELTPAAAADAKPVSKKQDSAGGGAVSIVTYVDYLCPYCGEFERANIDQIGKLVDSGAATIEIHPIPLLASHSVGTKYSLRADNAAACVANYDPNSFWAFNRELFDNQPQENTAGLTDQQLKTLVKKAGTKNDDSVSKCIDDGRFESWAQSALDRALGGSIPNSSVKQFKGTPLILVNGKQYQGSLTDPDEFRAFIVKAQADTYSTPTPTPTPTATTTPTS